MTRTHRIRLAISIIVALIAAATALASQPLPLPSSSSHLSTSSLSTQATKKLASLEVKGKAPKSGYSRLQFGNGWRETNGCDTRNIILARDLKDVQTNKKCQVMSGKLNDPYTGKIISFARGPSTSDVVQIDHVVALSNAWQTGAQQLSFKTREDFANDPLELLAVDGPANQQKSDGDAATWLPSNKSFRCGYVARQVDIKVKYHLWVSAPEKSAIERVLSSC